MADIDVSDSFGIPDNTKLGTILNNDINNILWALSGVKTTPGEYRKAVMHLLDTQPGVLAQNVGMPDPVIYRTKVGTTSDRYAHQARARIWRGSEKTDAQAACMRALLDTGTDLVTIAIEACRERGVIVASYRMNVEDFYAGKLDLSGFGREHKHMRILGANCLGPARGAQTSHGDLHRRGQRARY